MSIPGTLAAGTGVIPFVAARACTISVVYAAVGTAPSGSSVVFDVNKNGVTIFSTQGNRPTITTGNTVSGAATPDVTSVAAGDKITVDIDSIGGPAANACVTLDIV
jgi:PDZ domain-containing secreted protein